MTGLREKASRESNPRRAYRKVRKGAVRTALSLVGTEKERILAVKDEIEAAGIQKPEPPTPLEIVSENQVKLVTWMAVKGSISTTV